MVGPLKVRGTRPIARKTGKAPSIPVIGGVCALLAIVAVASMDSRAENPAATDRPVVATPADALAPLKTEIESLSTRLKKLRERLEATSQPSPTTDLDALRIQLDQLVKSSATLAPLVKKVEILEDQFADADKQVASFRERVATVKTQRKEAADAARVAATARRPVSPSDDEISKGIEAFKASRYKEANALFRALTVSRPEDARVWYYAALSHGLATKVWKDETIGLFNKAVEREKAGTPDKGKIDASLASVVEPSVKKWVDYFRKLAQR